VMNVVVWLKLIQRVVVPVMTVGMTITSVSGTDVVKT